jgi:hypothetical protein
MIFFDSLSMQTIFSSTVDDTITFRDQLLTSCPGALCVSVTTCVWVAKAGHDDIHFFICLLQTQKLD